MLKNVNALASFSPAFLSKSPNSSNSKSDLDLLPAPQSKSSPHRDSRVTNSSLPIAVVGSV